MVSFKGLAIKLFVWSLLISSSGADNNDTVKQLYVGALLPMTTYWWAKYSQILPTLFNYAFDEIANKSDVLPGYKLNLIVKDTKGIPGLGMKRYEEMVTEQPRKIALLGPCSSDEALVISQVTHYYNMVEMMFVPRTSTLADRKRYPSIYLTNYLEEIFNPPRIAMMKYFGWTKVATLAMTDDIFSANIDSFHFLLEQNNFTVVTSGIISDELHVTQHIQRLKHYHARIIIGAFYGSHALHIFCEAYRQGFYGRGIVWILPLVETYITWESKWEGAGVLCTFEEIQIAANSFFTLGNNRPGNFNTSTISGKTPEEFEALVRDLGGKDAKISSAIPYAYDAVWALALALNQTSANLPPGTDLTEFTYDSLTMYQTLKRELETVKFEGVSGSVSFGKDGQRLGPTYIYQIIDRVSSLVGRYCPGEDLIVWDVPPASLWPGGHIPKDRFAYRKLYPRLSQTAVVVVMCFNSAGVVSAFIFLGFNIAYRGRRSIKMSSPNINNLIVLGCVVMYTMVYINSAELWDNPPDFTYQLCMIRVWVMSLGFTLSFGALFSKTWRVHILFRSAQLKKKTVRDKKLFGLVGLLLLVDLAILIPWQIVHPLTEVHKKHSEYVHSSGDVIVTEMYIVCDSLYQMYWIAATYVYKGLLLVFGTFLAWETKKVSIPVLNDSRQIGFCVYNVVVICAFAVPVNHALSANQSTLRFVISSAFTIFCTTLVLCIVFVPKVLKRNETVPEVFMNTDGTSKPRGQTSNVLKASSSSSTSRTSCKVAPEGLLPQLQEVPRDTLIPSDPISQLNVASPICNERATDGNG